MDDSIDRGFHSLQGCREEIGYIPSGVCVLVVVSMCEGVCSHPSLWEEIRGGVLEVPVATEGSGGKRLVPQAQTAHSLSALCLKQPSA